MIWRKIYHHTKAMNDKRGKEKDEQSANENKTMRRNWITKMEEPRMHSCAWHIQLKNICVSSDSHPLHSLFSCIHFISTLRVACIGIAWSYKIQSNPHHSTQISVFITKIDIIRHIWEGERATKWVDQSRANKHFWCFSKNLMVSIQLEHWANIKIAKHTC